MKIVIINKKAVNPKNSGLTAFLFLARIFCNHITQHERRMKKHLDKYPLGVYNVSSKGDDKMEETKECLHKTKKRCEKEYKDLINRLNRIEGQVRGIKKMVEKDAYCPNILIQVSAVNAALNSFNKVLLANHIRTCVVDDIKAGTEETIDELVTVLQKLMK